jgi:integrase
VAGSAGRKPGFCAHRVLTRPAADETKSRARRRVIGIPEALLGILREHHAEQAHERERAGQLWQAGGSVFTAPTGAPINPNADYHEWKRLLLAAGLRDGRLHDARHTAATVLLLLGVPERAVMGLMGWSTTAMAARYQHITEPIRRDVAARVGGLIWAEPNGPGAAVDQAN